jgi:valyl-tRNA synthetase
VAIAWLASVDFVPALPGPSVCTLVVAGLEVSVGRPERSSGPTDHAGLERALETERANIARLEAQLANQQFLSKARPEVVEQARQRLAVAKERFANLEDVFSRA